MPSFTTSSKLSSERLPGRPGTAVRVLLAVALVAAVATATGVLRDAPSRLAADPAATVTGTVVDEQGRGLAGASVSLLSGSEVRTDAQGRFSLGADEGAHLVTVRAEGHLPRTQALETGVPAHVLLTGEAPETVALRFGGDVMFGRRYLDGDEDGDRSDGRLAPGASVAQHAALLEHVQPLLEDADLTVVNLETPLLEDPFIDPTAPRPPAVHPTKELVFASATESVAALEDVGVDVVALGNNHVFDVTAHGLESTIIALDRAGIPHFGAGRTVEEAWAPAVVERKGQRFAYLGCTTVTGLSEPVSYVAAESKGGAAACSDDRLADEVRAARADGLSVVVMIHGGASTRPSRRGWSGA